MLALKVGKKLAQKAKEELVALKALAPGLKAVRAGEFVFFPVLSKTKVSVLHSFAQKDFSRVEKVPSLKEILSSLLAEGDADAVSRSYDLVGDIAVLEFPKKLAGKKRAIARALLSSNKRIKTVLGRVGGRTGIFRLKEYEWLAGEKKFETVHRESGCSFKVDLPNVFFSSRLVSERERIASLVKNGERVLVLFAGVGPFAIVIARKKRVSVRAVELNPRAVELMRENAVLNKVAGNVTVFEGDARVFARKFGGWADRILMPAPHGSERFLGAVIANAGKGCTIHYYNLGGEKEGVFSKALDDVSKNCAAKGRKFKILFKRRVLPYAPRVFTVCIDFKLLN
ncbi:MAG: class I SAM-dependent methyltransferase family protein [Candidatus Micrarchaeota archaeon]